jgi:hypothetical protein
MRAVKGMAVDQVRQMEGERTRKKYWNVKLQSQKRSGQVTGSV